MTYPPPNPYDPSRAPGRQPFGQPSHQSPGEVPQPGYGIPSQPGDGYSVPPPPGGGHGVLPQPGYSVPPQPGGGYGIPPQQPAFPPPPGAPYGAPPMPPASGGGGGLLVKILSGAGVLVIGLVIVIVRSLSSDSSSDSSDTAIDAATEPATETPTDTPASTEEEKEKPPADGAVGDCITDSIVEPSDLIVACDSPTAFWTITQVSDDSGGTVTILGDLEDPSIVSTVCGQEYMGWTPGELWKSYQVVYSESFEGIGGPVDYLYCVEAIDEEDADGGRPATPDVGQCSDGTTIRTFDCSNANAAYVVDEFETYDPPIEELEFDQNTALGGCSGSDYLAMPISGGNEILPLVYLAYCFSDA